MASAWRMEARSFTRARREFAEIAKALDVATPMGQSRGLFRIALGLVREGLAKAGSELRDKARSNARASGAPRRLSSGPRPAIFSFADFDAARGSKRSRSALVGVRTGLARRAPDRNLYIHWGRGAIRRKDSTVATGGLSMSLGALFERGTIDGRIRARRYFTGAYGAMKHQILKTVGQSYIRAVQLLKDAK